MSPRCLVIFGLLVACTTQRNEPPKQKQTPSHAEQTPQDASPANAEQDVEEPAPSNAATELTAEEKALLQRDPASLTREQRRARAHALRKKIMQDPDSPAAQAIEDARKAIEAGEVDPTVPPEGGSEPSANKQITLEAPSAGGTGQ